MIRRRVPHAGDGTQSDNARGTRALACAAVAAMPIAAWLLGSMAWAILSTPASPGAELESYVTAAVTGVGAAACGYLTLASTLMLGAALTGSLPRWTATLAPRAWRRIIATAAGVTLSVGVGVPALAVDSIPGWTDAAPSVAVDAAPGWASGEAGSLRAEIAPAETRNDATSTAVDAYAGWLNHATGASDTAEDSAPHEPAADGDAAAASDTRAESTLTVAEGDSLWKLTAELTGARDSQVVADAWPLLYEENRDVIGDDPGLLLPGQVLRVPAELAR